MGVRMKYPHMRGRFLGGISAGKKQPKKAIGVQRGEKSGKLVSSLFVSNQIFVSCRLPSIDWCGLGEESIFFFCVLFRKLVSFNCNIEDLSALDAPLIDAVN